MKKGICVIALCLLFGLALPASAEGQVTSDVGITFYQKSSKNQVIPMEKVTVKVEPLAKTASSRSLFATFPKTNQQTSWFLTFLGAVLLIGFSCLYCWEKLGARRNEANR